MSTVYDRAVRSLQRVYPSLDEHGHPLAYYCGGPPLTCTRPACRFVSVLVEDNLLHHPCLAPSDHVQESRPDGTWGCVCGWAQDKPHADHVREVGQ